MKNRIVYVVLAALGLLMAPKPSAAMPPMAPIPSMDFNVKEGKIHVSSAPIVEVYLPRDREPNCSLNWESRLKDRDRKAGKVDVAKLGDQLQPKDFEAVESYVAWLQRQVHVGDNLESTGKFLTFPEGMAVLIRPGLTQLNGVKLMLGSVDGGLTWNAGIPVRGKGWGIPFSYSQLQAGPHEFLALVVDHSNSRTVKVFLFTFGSKAGLGNQWASYQFVVREAVYEDGERFDVSRLSLADLVKHCDGLIEPYTPRPQGIEPQTIRATGDTDTDTDHDHVKDRDRRYRRDEEFRRDGRSIRRPSRDRDETPKAREPEEVEVRVELEDCDGHILERDVVADVYALNENGDEVARKRVTINGPTSVRIKPGDKYRVDVTGDFESIESKVDGDRVLYTFREKRVVRESRQTEEPRSMERGQEREDTRKRNPELVTYKLSMSPELLEWLRREWPESKLQDLVSWMVDGQVVRLKTGQLFANEDGESSFVFVEQFDRGSNVTVAFSTKVVDRLYFFRAAGRDGLVLNKGEAWPDGDRWFVIRRKGGRQ